MAVLQWKLPIMLRDYARMSGMMDSYSLPSMNVNPREWIKVSIYRGVNS